MLGRDGGTEQKRLRHNRSRSRANAASSPLLTIPNAGSARRSLAIGLLSAASVSAGAPSIASRIRRETTPSRS